MLAAFLLGQLENMNQITGRRAAIADRYARMLAPLLHAGRVRMTAVPQHCASNHHMVNLLTANIEERTALIAHLRESGILAVFHYVPLHSAPFAQALGLPERRLEVTDDASGRLLRLPMYFDLTDGEIDEVAGEILRFYSNNEASAAHAAS